MNTNFFNKLKSIAKRNEEEFEYQGLPVKIREMSGNMRDYYEGDIQKRVKFNGRHPDMNTLNTVGQRALVVAMTLVDAETDELAFDYKSKEDLESLGELSADFLDIVFDKANVLCGIAPESQEETEKN